MRTQWHRIEWPQAPKGHALTATIRGQSWRTFERSDGSWILEPVSPPGRPIVRRSLSEARDYAEPMARRNPEITAPSARRMLSKGHAVFKVEFMPLSDTKLSREMDARGFSGWGSIQELFTDADEARERFRELKRSGDVEYVLRYSLSPGRGGGWTASLNEAYPKKYEELRGKVYHRRRNGVLLGHVTQTLPNPSEHWEWLRSQGMTDSLEDAALQFELAVDEALESCFERYPPARGSDADALFGEPTAAVDIYLTLARTGAGIWDGRWDRYYPGYRERQWQRLIECFRSELARPFAILEHELRESAYTAEVHLNPEHRRAHRLARKLST